MDLQIDIQKQRWRRRTAKPALVVLHRCDLSRADGTYPDVAAIPSSSATYKDFLAAFADERKFRPGAYTGGRFPYTFVIEQNGTTTQVAPLSAATPHAERWNDRAIGVMLVGDFRRISPTPEQWVNLTELLYWLDKEGYIVNGIKGHTDLPHGCSDPTKICPGRHLNPTAVALAVRGVVPGKRPVFVT